VTPIAGTTRDVIEVQLDLGGYPVLLADTAGLREAADVVESEGIRRALARAGSADLRIALFDATAWPALDPMTLALVDDATLPVLNKIDRQPVPATARIAGRAPLQLSLASGEGFAALLARLTELVGERYAPGEAPFLTRARHRTALEDCRSALRRALETPLPELVAEDLRLAVRALGRITGAVDLEDILDRIFAEFCIGK
jgi:tRNA modification GTPase